MKVVASNASAPSIYEHLSVRHLDVLHETAEEHRLELERAREELRNTKKQLAGRDAELLQLKTAHRKLQDALRKKDKDLQNVFSVLRAPQDAELTKKRRTELVERLLMETQQRVVNAEAVAEERKRELEKLKFSSKFLRFQELDVEIEECHHEIERLRSQLSQYTVVGTLRISNRNGTTANPKTPATAKSKSSRRESGGNQAEIHATHYREQVVTPIVQRVPPAPETSTPLPIASASSGKRDSFVERTRRRAVEAEYQKQVRLAQLEAECELEENLRILAKREAAAQAEMQRRNSQQQRRSSRIARVDTNEAVEYPVVVSPENVAPLGETRQPIAPEVSALSPGLEVDVAAAKPDGVETRVSVEVGQAVGGLISSVVVAIAEEDRPPVPHAAVNDDALEPKQYDEYDGSDELNVEEKDAVKSTPEPVEGASESEDAIEEGSGIGIVAHEGVSRAEVKVPQDEVDEEVDDPQLDHEGHETLPKREEPVEDVDSDDETSPDVNLPRQGFLIDPVNNVQVPYSTILQEHGSVPEVEGIEKPNQVNEQKPAAAKGNPSASEANVGESNDFYEEEEEDEKEEVEAEVVVEGDLKAKEVKPEKYAVDEVKEEKTHDPEETNEVFTEGILQDTKEETSGQEEKEETLHHDEQKEREPPEADGQDEDDNMYGTPSDDDNGSQEAKEAEPKLPDLEQKANALALRNDTQRDDAAGETDENAVDPTPRDEDQEPTAATTSPTVEAVIPVTEPQSADPEPPAEATQEDTVALTLHACDDAIGAASALIHGQIDAALAESVSAGLTTVPTPQDAAIGPSDLSPAELALAMDAAARKIQKFWRDMDARYTTPRASAASATPPTEPVEPTEAAGVTEEEGQATRESPERVESPIVSDAEAGEEEEDGW